MLLCLSLFCRDRHGNCGAAVIHHHDSPQSRRTRLALLLAPGVVFSLIWRQVLHRII